MSELNEGYYDATLKGIDLETDPYDDGAVQVQFQCEADGHTVTCRHSTGKWVGNTPSDDKAKRFLDVLGVFNLDDPKQIGKLNDHVGKTVRVRAKLSDKGRMYYYIATGKKGKKISLNDALTRIKGDEVPF